MLKIEIFKENENLQIRTIPGKDGKQPRTIYEQTAYAYLGGKFPVEMKLNLEEGQPPHVAGFYTVHSSSFVINNFGGLELKRFGLLLTSLEPDL
ncbi:single-stranded DNA-binding protein [Vibrio aestuarianus]|uniref:Single-stranded DNA-binding protein n=1 Tax=Vibrio aestuarianus TaxID=28171 RepID=A0ABN8TLT1_9VIBR|nr:single-stranded DNA-binding protein [Vibrio aestuarianus]MDE1228358.1 G5P family DNA-binding protein [Vibrio aestuarianus]MDE1228363.1 G5P family DNA-binding protein [Vibrio aestuarianus]MDE1259131.1 G5P family DNA-binding protein [Vibrio aestuarianus]MDE1273372.1 G5P family DNA-binding protein [Vibrio aestuarianus]MDE1291738.1 G5P family DNA-binding protein [Vibrio aestuarianus]